jgi:hypothetical protein
VKCRWQRFDSSSAGVAKDSGKSQPKVVSKKAPPTDKEIKGATGISDKQLEEFKNSGRDQR